MKNEIIRDAARKTNVMLWQIAERLGINDGNFSRRLRHELPEDEQQRILQIINDLAAEREGGRTHG